jgi:polysaccharide export outer membrane protein
MSILQFRMVKAMSRALPALTVVSVLLSAASLSAQTATDTPGVVAAPGGSTSASRSTESPVLGPGGVPLPADYVIGPEDVLGVLFWREADMSVAEVTVRSDGKITLPLLGDLVASGKKPDALKGELEKAASKYLTEPNVTVAVRQVNSLKVYILGEVKNPGPYPLAGPRTVMQLIALAGGLNEYAKKNDIRVIRTEEGRQRSFPFHYEHVVSGRALAQNLQLLPGDTVVVP